MICPRCNALWDPAQQACTHCGLTLRTKHANAPVVRPVSAPLRDAVRRAHPLEAFPASASPPVTPPPAANADAQWPHASHPSTSRVSNNGPDTPLPPLFPTVLPTETEEEALQSEKPLKVKVHVAASQPLQPQDQDRAQMAVAPRSAMPEKRTDRLAHHPRVQPATDALRWEQDAASRANPHAQQAARPPEEKRARPQAAPRSEQHSPQSSLRPLTPGTLLFSDRYRLGEFQGKQSWLSGAYEALWLAQDAQRGGALVSLCEFAVPGRDALTRHALVRSATMALHSVSRHTHVPTLLDVFSDQDRSFFVFEYIEGESLLSRMQRFGRGLAEQEILECCLQLTDVLHFMAQQSPPVVHGQIRPENILVGRTRSHYILTNFSVMLASGATPFTNGVPRAQLSPYTPPEFAHGVIDARSDMYALLATAYHLATGSVPTRSNGAIMLARRLNPNLSAQFEALLAKGLYSGQGLRPDLSQRYQQPAELREALLMKHSVSGTLAALEAVHVYEPPAPVPVPAAPSPAQAANVLQNHPILQALAAEPERDEAVLLLPTPEDLPPLPEANDGQPAFLWLASLLVCLALVIFATRGWT